jgi:membrane-associated protein
LLDGLLEMVHGAATSPWFYLALAVFACVDGFFPVVPSETLVITAGVYAASGEPQLLAAAGCAAAGAFTGDHVSYLAGRRWRGRLGGGPRRAALLERAGRVLAARGGLALVVARYVPGGRTAVTLAMGASGYPARPFAGFAALAAVSWAAYSAAVGYLGGAAFEDDPLRGLGLGLGLAAAVTVVAEAARFARRRSMRSRAFSCPSR